MSKLLSLIVSIFLSIISFSQVPIGQWTAHIPNFKGLSVCEVESKIYCLTETGVFYFNRGDNSIQKIGKIEGLSGINTRCIIYHQATKSVYIGYDDGTIDIIKNNNQITTLTDIKRKSFPSKTINKIQIINDLVYFCTDFGIVVYNPYKLEFVDTYIIGENGYESKIYALTNDQTYFYAATENGIKKAEINSLQLPDYKTWERLNYIPNYNKKFNAIAIFKNQIIASYVSPWEYNYKTYVINTEDQSYLTLNPDTENFTMNLKVIDNQLFVIHKNHIGIYDNFESPTHFINSTLFSWGSVGINTFDAIIDSDQSLWYSDLSFGLVRNDYNDKIPTTKFPNSPNNNDAYYLNSRDNQTWVASGALDVSGANTNTPAAVSRLKNGFWKTFNKSNVDSLNGVVDLISVEANPNNPNQIFCSSWNSGVIEMNIDGDNVTSCQVYNETNSSLKVFYGNLVKVWDCKVDKNNNLWVVNPGTTTPINVKLANGDWKAYATPSYNSSWGNFIIAKDGTKWFLLPRGNGIFVFNDFGNYDNTEGHFQKHLSVNDEYGDIISNDVYTIAEDKSNQIWVGTNNGVVVYFSPQDLYNDIDNLYASKIIIDINGKAEYLMEGKKVTAICVDGANRKWIGTEQSGLFLMSEDGTKQILTFNSENSPLPSNQIKSISIDNSSGEVFIATGNGLMSYRGEATEGTEFFKDVYAFPNPVKPDYDGPITIKGLVENTIVKITDISGNLVTEMYSLGGQAIWDGKNLNGNRVKTGIYLVFLSDESGEKTEVTKILFIN